MDERILELYPSPGRHHELKGLYLEQLAGARPAGEGPFIYSNFISSLDGRIALPAPGRNSHRVPPAIANPRDWRLFQELAAQADLLISSARYFRQAEDDEAQAELPLGSSAEFDDLRQWRSDRGLPPQPDIAVFSASLDIPPEALRRYPDRRIIILSGATADARRIEAIENNSHARVVRCGEGRRVDGSQLRDTLRALGYRLVYAIAGPAVLHSLLEGDALDRLYHTTAHCLLGGERFDTFVSGRELQPARCLPLQAMYLDRAAPRGAGQTLAVYGNEASR